MTNFLLLRRLMRPLFEADGTGNLAIVGDSRRTPAPMTLQWKNRHTVKKQHGYSERHRRYC
jgi:hypothetical protein